MIVPTRRLALVAAGSSALVALLVETLSSPWWAISLTVFGALVLVGVLDGLVAGRWRGIEVQRVLPSAVSVGERAVIEWRWTNRLHRTVLIAFADELAPSLGAVRRGQLTVPANGRATSSVEMCPTRRGRFEPTRLAIRLRGPLGLAARQQHRDLPSTLRVVPRFRSQAAVELKLDQHQIIERGMRSARHRGGGTEFAQLRDYVEGDDHRRVDWAATGRAGRTIVREYTAEQHQNVLVLLDNGRVMSGRIADVPRLEYAMDVAMSLAAATRRTRDRVGLTVFDRSIRAQVPFGSGRSQQEAIVEAVFDLEPEVSESEYRSAISTALAANRRRTLFVLLTELVEPVVADSVAAAVRVVAARHPVIVASVVDPKLEEWARPVDVDGVDVDVDVAYRAAAAATAAAARARAAELLVDAGAIVVDEPPDELAWAVVDRYLRLKATGRL